MEIFESTEDAVIADVMATSDAALKAGFAQQEVDEGHILCAKEGTMELVDIFPDGSWEYQNVTDEGKTESMSGSSASLLALYLASPENKKIFEDDAD